MFLGVINRVPIGHRSIDGTGGVWVASEHLLATTGAGRGANPLDPAVKGDVAARMPRSVPCSVVILTTELEAHAVLMAGRHLHLLVNLDLAGSFAAIGCFEESIV